MESYIIVGAGIAGLTAANTLARPGRKITVIEQSAHPGGRAITQQEAGFSLNLGPHALYRGGLATRTFKEWEIPFVGHLPAQGNGFLVYRGEKYPLITNAVSLVWSPLFTFAEKVEAANLLRQFASDAPPDQTMRAWIEARATSPKVRDFAAAITRVSTFAADLDHLSARQTLRQISLAVKSNVAYLDRGWQTLVDGIAARARSLGVEIRCGEPIDSVANLDADGIILAVPPASVEKLTGLRLPNLRPIRVACLDLGLDSLPSSAATFGLGMDRPLYFSVHSAAAKLAPEGSALIQLAKYFAGDSDPAADRAELEQFADLLAPGWRDRVTMTRFLPSMTVTHAIPAPEGRPAVDAIPDERVLIAGDWVGEEHMLTDAAVSSALRAASTSQRRTLSNEASSVLA